MLITYKLITYKRNSNNKVQKNKFIKLEHINKSKPKKKKVNKLALLQWNLEVENVKEFKLIMYLHSILQRQKKQSHVILDSLKSNCLQNIN